MCADSDSLQMDLSPWITWMQQLDSCSQRRNSRKQDGLWRAKMRRRCHQFVLTVNTVLDTKLCCAGHRLQSVSKSIYSPQSIRRGACVQIRYCYLHKFVANKMRRPRCRRKRRRVAVQGGPKLKTLWLVAHIVRTTRLICMTFHECLVPNSFVNFIFINYVK